MQEHQELNFMRLDQKSVHRKEMIPWYDSDYSHYILIVLMFLIFLFGVQGVAATKQNADYNDFFWPPTIILVLSGLLIISSVLRIVRRYIRKYQERQI
jgi:hypothetical protein